MKRFVQNKHYVVLLTLLSLQFITVPFLEDIDKAGKLYLFIFLTLGYSLVFFLSKTTLKVSSVATSLILIWVVFLVFSVQSLYFEWVLIQTMILAVFLLFLYIAVHGFNENLNRYECFIDILILFSVLSALLGLYEYFHFVLVGPSHTMLIPYLLPADLTIRVGGTYGQPNLFAVFLSLSILAFFYKYIHVSSESPRRIVLGTRFVPFMLVCVVFFLTGSRAGFLSISLILGFLSWLVASGRYLNREHFRKKEFLYLTLCLVSSLFIAKGLNLYYGPEILSQGLGDTGISTEARFIFWTSAVLIFLDHPWFGIGLDNYQFLMNSYGPKSHSLLGFVQYESMRNSIWAHNEVLQLVCEGGVIILLFLIFLLGLFSIKFWRKFIVRNTQFSPLFLYSHLFLLPFILQSMFSWPFRSPPHLILFFTFLGGLLAQYPLQTLAIKVRLKKIICILVLIGFLGASGLFYQEIKIGAFKKNLQKAVNIEDTFDEFVKLAANPYSEHRVLSNALIHYARKGLNQENGSFAGRVLPYYERLCQLEGVRWQWYILAQIYLKLDREADAHRAIQHAINLMPSEQRFWDFSHYLNVLKASRDTGRPVRSFYPPEVNFDFNVTGLWNE